jgi:glycosyltransferase involved in cell wall biosynthesis
VPSGKLEDYPAALADAIDRTLRDAELRDKLSILGRDREALFSWRAAADAVWQLHADL